MKKNSHSQFAIGSNNTQIEIKKMLCTVVDKAFKEVEVFFETYDSKINKCFPEGIEYSKLKDVKRKFSCSRILSSLIKLGIPLEYAYQIVLDAVLKLEINIDDGMYESGLSTHKIRKVVADAILYCNLEGVTIEDIEAWGNKYVRRYGHDSQRTKVYFKNTEITSDVEYELVKNTLLPDVIFELKIKENLYSEKITSNQVNSMSEEIVDFINNCNMYRISYDILKAFIIEMALQPPHPWFVTEDTAMKISKYDLDILPKHYERLLCSKENNSFEELHYTVCETLHHASSSILARYKEILGCNDLDAFYNLYRIVNNLIKRTYNDLLIDKCEINNLPSDLMYIDITLDNFYELLERIKRKLMDRRNLFNVTRDFVCDIIQLCDIAKALGNNVSKENIRIFLNSDWNNYLDAEKNKHINAIFLAIEGISTRKIIRKLSNSFWINKNKFESTDKQILVVCAEENMDYESIIEYVSSKKVNKFIDSMILIMEKESEKEQYKELIEKLDKFNFVVEVMDKEDLNKLYYSDHKISVFNEIMMRDIFE